MQATRRLQHIQRTLGLQDSALTSQVSRAGKRVLILSDKSEVFVSEPTGDGKFTVTVGSDEVLSVRPLNRSAALVLSAIGTPFEENNPTPKYTVLELSSAQYDARSTTATYSDLWACIYALWTLYHVQENIPIAFSPSFSNVHELIKIGRAHV